MNRRQWMWMITILVLALLVAASAPEFLAQEALAQEVAAEQPQQPAQPTGEETVEQILRQQESLITGQGYNYSPAGRRDPFRPLFPAGTRPDERPPGLAGMLVAELDLVGVINDTRDGDVVVVNGPDGKGYFLRVGDEVFDGTVIAIDTRLGTMTFRQEIDDPRRIKPYRDIVKRLVPLEDEESGDE